MIKVWQSHPIHPIHTNSFLSRTVMSSPPVEQDTALPIAQLAPNELDSSTTNGSNLNMTSMQPSDQGFDTVVAVPTGDGSVEGIEESSEVISESETSEWDEIRTLCKRPRRQLTIHMCRLNAFISPQSSIHSICSEQKYNLMSSSYYDAKEENKKLQEEVKSLCEIARRDSLRLRCSQIAAQSTLTYVAKASDLIGFMASREKWVTQERRAQKAVGAVEHLKYVSKLLDIIVDKLVPES